MAQTTKTIGYKTPFGKYKTITKTFNSEAHYDNWYKVMVNKGYKIIGTT